MIKSITVTNYLGDSIQLELAKPEKSGFIVKSITGLGPGKSTINATEVSTGDGSVFNSSRMSSRNIVLSLQFLGDDNIEDIRQLSYKYFPIKRKVTLLIETDNRTSEIDGYVESNEPDIFSKEEGAEISIICPNPFFYSAYELHSTTFGVIMPAFEFPFSNESLTLPLIELSTIEKQPNRNLIYTGDCETGVTIHIRASGPATNIALYNVGTREVMRINTNTLSALTGSGVISGDEIVICTVKGSKSASLIRNGKMTNILNCINKDADWFQISKGSNIFAYTAETGSEDIQIEIQNRVVYEGA